MSKDFLSLRDYFCQQWAKSLTREEDHGYRKDHWWPPHKTKPVQKAVRHRKSCGLILVCDVKSAKCIFVPAFGALSGYYKNASAFGRPCRRSSHSLSFLL
ncbi:unnamed protein product [Caretta caretta]